MDEADFLRLIRGETRGPLAGAARAGLAAAARLYNLGVGAHPCTDGPQIAGLSCVDGSWYVGYAAPGGCNGHAIVEAANCDSDNSFERTSGRSSTT